MAKQKKGPEYLIDKVSRHLETAYTFGFTPIETPEYSKKALKKYTDLMNSRLSFLNFFYDEGLHKKEIQPYLFAYELPFKKSGRRKSSKYTELGLEIIGKLQSVSDAMVIKTATAILEDEGYKNLYVVINSIGDKESAEKLEKDLTEYFRKNINSLPAKLRQSFKNDIWNIFDTTNKKADEFRARAPKSMNCLTDVSKKHFKEVLEYLEKLEIPYELNPDLVGERGVSVHTVFEIKQKKKGKDEVLATGTRYDHMSRDLGHRKELPAVGVEIKFAKKKKDSTVTLSRIKKPDFFFIQLGYEAKLRSLNIIDMLRKKKVRIGHDLTKDKITMQMKKAERMRVAKLVLVGQKEALEDTVVIRDLKNRSQNVVELKNLPKELKKISKKINK